MTTGSGYHIAIVGGGVVGCALALALAPRFKRIVVLEKESAPGMHASGRNSLTDVELRRFLCERGLTQAAQFSWDRTARETVAVYQNVVQG